ncbi:MAG TPA: GxxExxY protein, partial [Candidatus Paceibacterota bacterium]
YEACLSYELRESGFDVQVGLPVVYRGVRLDVGYRLDLIVNDAVIVEVKACDSINSVHHAQVLSYLKLSGKQVGLIINFHELHLKDGIKRFVNRDFKTSESSLSSVVKTGLEE